VHQTLVVDQRYLIGFEIALSSHEPAEFVRDAATIAYILRRCVDNTHEMRQLRALAATAQGAEYVNLLSDVAVVDLVVRLTDHGRLRVLEIVKYEVLPGVPMEVRRATAAVGGRRPPPPPPPQTASTPRRAEVEVVPSFSGDLDAAALVAGLLQASQDGTPFCEECARAARAA
jgi:hypothetical protein